MKFFDVENIKSLLLKNGLYWDGMVLEGGFKDRARPATVEDFERDYKYPMVEILSLKDKVCFNLFLRIQDTILELYEERYDRACDEDYLYRVGDFSEEWQQLNLSLNRKAYEPVLRDSLDLRRKLIMKNYGEKIAELEQKIAELQTAMVEKLKPIDEMEKQLTREESEPIN